MPNSTRLDDKVMLALIASNPGNLSRAMRAEAQEIVADWRLSFGTSPSSPGEPPGVDTGAMRAGTHTYSEGQFRQIVEDGTEYGIIHEWGIGDHPPRPSLVPVFEQHMKTIHMRIRDAIR